MRQPRNILYIDDDDGLRRLVEKLLSRRGHTVATAASGPEGVEKARATNFELIAVDHYMPGMDGLETLAALRELPDCPPIIYVTGSEESAVAVAALKAGAFEYVVKSTGDDFVNLLEQAFAHALAAERLRDDKEIAEERLRDANERLETLLREVNHRVANSLQLVSAMVTMQAKLLPDKAAREALADTERRIQAIAQVHRKLYTADDVEGVAIDEYLRAIVEELQATWSTPVSPRTIRLEAEALRLHTDKAVSLGVIVNELVSNACKYAYEAGRAGEIRVRLARHGESPKFRLEVEDDGCGLTDGEAPRGTGLGSKLIAAMAKSLSSAVDYDRDHAGCRAVLVAPI
ncbi:MAG: response regulator [Sphingomicrobium sp.]